MSGLGDARLFDVVCTIGTNKASSYEPSSSSEVIRTLVAKKTALESEKTVRETESELLLKYAQTLSGEHVTPTQMGQFLGSYVDQGRKIVQAVRTTTRISMSSYLVPLWTYAGRWAERTDSWDHPPHWSRKWEKHLKARYSLRRSWRRRCRWWGEHRWAQAHLQFVIRTFFCSKRN